MPSISPKCQVFRTLHADGCFVIPNPWDIGSARYLRHLGFRALATSSAGYAFAQGLPDGAVSKAEMLRHIAGIVTATDLPVNADFGPGFADAPEQVAKNVKECIDTGVAGLSIEDATGRESEPLYDLALAVERIKAARAAVDESNSGVLFTARAECYLTGHPKPFEESLRRLRAYAAAGADVLYAPGVAKREEMQAIVSAVAPKPVNILMGSNVGLQVSDLAAMGVRRISVGSSLARSAWTGFIRAAAAIAEKGSFEGFNGLTPFAELNAIFQGESSVG